MWRLEFEPIGMEIQWLVLFALRETEYSERFPFRVEWKATVEGKHEIWREIAPPGEVLEWSVGTCCPLVVGE